LGSRQTFHPHRQRRYLEVWEFKSLGSFLVWGQVLGDDDLTALSITLGVAVSVAAAALTYLVVGATRRVR
jgi:hypothetical protein